MIKRTIFPVLVAILLFHFSGCKKNGDHDLLLNPVNLTFDYDDDIRTITISNIGSSEVTWELTCSSDILSFSKTSGRCSKNNPDKFDIRVQRAKIHKDSTRVNVTIQASSGEAETLSLMVLGFPENKIRLSKYLYDAAYDRVHDRLVLLTASSNLYGLDILDLSTLELDNVPLPADADYLSVSPDGTFAIASNEYGSVVYYVDLAQKKVTGQFGTEEIYFGLTATQDKFCYYFPYYQNDGIVKMDLNTGENAFHSLGDYVMANRLALHPSGKYLYCAGYNSLFKIDILAPEPVLVYKNQAYASESNLWISKDGTKIYTGAKHVLTINASLPGNDITNIATIPAGTGYICALDDNPVYPEYYFVPSDQSMTCDEHSNLFMVMDAGNKLKRTVTLERFFISSFNPQGYITIQAAGMYVFSSSNGNRIVVVSAPLHYSGQFGIEIIDRNWK